MSNLMPAIIIDSREQLPYQFPESSITAALQTGDYSLVGFESVFEVERNALSDFIGCCTWGRSRFERELQRAGIMTRL
ncbi:MAG: hypothetical protein COZ70_11115 [Deltaproteobacteria bacterium CG_4_8_14_3_um_filter_51_11]|nr:MAG: hypothetical protein COZ70_11115 [Deltaproteobacteria bacterium CG_4_8_14_3_um_filter_51_11]